MGILSVELRFLGGAQLLFDDQSCFSIELPEKNDKWLIRDLLLWIKENILKEREELFWQDDSVRPGILVLVNDTDWELLGTTKYEIQNNDTITFISTLHGG